MPNQRESRPFEKKRRLQFQEVLSFVVSQEDFDCVEVQSRCKEAKVQFVGNVLKQLTADRVLGILKSDSDDAPRRFTWIVSRNTFDIEDWIDRQVHGGHQVRQSPKEERPRERLLQHGAQNLKNSELLAILIRSGRKGESAVQAGQRIAGHFDGRLEALPYHSPVELKAVSKVVSEVAYCQIAAGIELGRRVAAATHSKSNKVKINSTRAAIEYCSGVFARLAQDSVQEEFHIVTLDTKLQPIQPHQITIGTLDSSLVHPREVFRPAVRDAASSILLVHNHPSGDPTPSQQDLDVTQRLKSAGELLGIQVIDHVIVASQRTISLADEAPNSPRNDF